MTRPDDSGQVAARERYSRALDGHVGASTHREADIGGRQRRRIVDPIACHRHPSATCLQVCDDPRFVLRTQIGVHGINITHSGRDRAGCRLIVTSQHNDAQPSCF